MANTYLHPDDRPSDIDGLWDASPGVCCAYFQTGACAHTEGADYEYEDDDTDAFLRHEAHGARLAAALAVPAPDVPDDDEPF